MLNQYQMFLQMLETAQIKFRVKDFHEGGVSFEVVIEDELANSYYEFTRDYKLLTITSVSKVHEAEYSA